MNKMLLHLSLAGLLVSPAIVQADTPAAKDKSAKQKTVAVQPAQASQHETVYITKSPFTGSHIPMVWRQYNGRIDSASNAAVYGQEDLNHTGKLDVASDLVLLDPSIQLGRRH